MLQMTFEEFRATRRSGILGEIHGDDDQTPVLIYCEFLFIFSDPLPDYRYHTVIENTCPTGSLEQLEREVYEWACL